MKKKNTSNVKKKKKEIKREKYQLKKSKCIVVRKSIFVMKIKKNIRSNTRLVKMIIN